MPKTKEQILIKKLKHYRHCARIQWDDETENFASRLRAKGRWKAYNHAINLVEESLKNQYKEAADKFNKEHPKEELINKNDIFLCQTQENGEARK